MHVKKVGRSIKEGVYSCDWLCQCYLIDEPPKFEAIAYSVEE